MMIKVPGSKMMQDNEKVYSKTKSKVTQTYLTKFHLKISQRYHNRKGVLGFGCWGFKVI